MGRKLGSRNRQKNANGNTQAAGIGHNTVSGDQLKSIVDRIERLEADKHSIADDIRDVYSEAKSNGYDCKALREIVRMRRQDHNDRSEHEAILETYMHALGMLADLPLGQAALRREGLVTEEHSEFDAEPGAFVGD